MKSNSADTKFIIVTFIFVSLVGAKTVTNLLEEDQDVAQPQASSSSLSSTRLPASIPANQKSAPQKTLRAWTQLDLACTSDKVKKANQSMVVRGTYVQFQGKDCQSSLPLEQVEIVNKSNGFTASLFQNGPDHYQTDLIQLNEGENEITIRYKQSSGSSVEQTVKVQSSKI
jgi:hypothetical protein